MRTPQIEHHDSLLPDVDGCPPGIVALSDQSVTVQCGICLRTNTGPTPFSVIVGDYGWNFFPDDDGLPASTVRRCPDCREKRIHPKETP